MAMAGATVSAAGLRVLKLLVGHPPQTVADLLKATGVTRTAVAEQLNELMAAGLIERKTERSDSPGRPHYRFSATHAALLLLFSSCPSQVVPAIWRAIEEVGGGKLTRKIVGRVGAVLAEHYKARITAKSPKKRLEHFVELLRDEGGLLDMVHQNGRVEIRKRSCPFIAILDAKRMVCTLDLEMMAEVVGRPVRRTACRHEGAPCCVIEIAPD